MGLFVGKLDNVVDVDLKATYGGKEVKLIKHYPDMSCYGYISTSDPDKFPQEFGPSYGFIRDSVVEIIDDKEG